MTEIKDVPDESCSSYSVFLKEHHFQEDYVEISSRKLTQKFENVLYLSAHKAIEQSYLISEMNWLRNQSMGRIGRLGRVTF